MPRQPPASDPTSDPIDSVLTPGSDTLIRRQSSIRSSARRRWLTGSQLRPLTVEFDSPDISGAFSGTSTPSSSLHCALSPLDMHHSGSSWGFYRKCLDVEGHVDLKKMIRCQACPSLEPFLDRLFQSQMVHCFFEDRLREQRLDPFETRCRSLTDSCLARCPPDAINFGDAIWITCKRNATSGGLRRYNRMRQKFSRHIFKNSSKSKGRHDRDSGLITFGGARGDDASVMGRSISFTTGQLDEPNSAAGKIRQNSLIPPLPRPKSTFSLALEQPESSSTSSATTTSRNGVGVTAPVGSSSSGRNNNPSSLFPSPQSRTLPSGPRPPLPPRPLRPSRPPRATEMATVSSPNRKILTSANSVDATMSASTMGLQRTNFTGASPANTLLSEIQKKLDSMESSGSFRKSVSASNLIVNTTSSSEDSVFQDVLNSEQLRKD
ncbi:hypothetical protein SprV_0100079500 [Sparganum proliferum]